MGAWEFGDANQPPALVYNDYDGTPATDDIDYCARFTLSQCGALIPGQRADTSPQIGPYTDALQLAAGDTPRRRDRECTPPLQCHRGRHRPGVDVERPPRSPVQATRSPLTAPSGSLLLTVASRASTRWVILRAITGPSGSTTTVNDYHLRILEGDAIEGQNPALRLGDTVARLELGASHRFTATHTSSGEVTWSVSNEALANITPQGRLTATAVGTVDVIATVAGDADHRGATTRHRVEIAPHPANLTLTAAPARLRTGSDQMAQFTATRDGTGEITWSIVEDSPAATIDPTSGRVTASTTAEMLTVQVTVAATATHAGETLTTPLEIDDFVDVDGDGLIEIYDLLMLDNMRHDLAGTSYKNAADATGDTTGCPSDSCSGYELMNDLDFDRDGDGRTWDPTDFTLDSGDNGAWFNAASGGWLPIGSAANAFTATLEGNGFVIRNLAVRRSRDNLGLFGRSSGTIRNLGLEQALAENTKTTGTRNTALLAGQMDGGAIIASHVSGVARSGALRTQLGGLVGYLTGGTITASYATGVVQGDATLGGLVGVMEAGSITASYATNAVTGGPLGDIAGGLMGVMDGGTITASYATGRVDGGAGDDEVGVLVGFRSSGTITASYGFGTVIGETVNGVGTPPATATALNLTAGTAGTGTQAGDEWNAAASGTLGAWSFGDANQPPALLYNDYDGHDNGIDYCALFTAANTPCGTLIPGQREATSPQFGSAFGDIHLAEGDSVHGVTANVLLPTHITVGGTPLELVWSVHHDPAGAANRVTVGNGLLRVNDNSRTTTRQIILRATRSDGTLVNDYTLRITRGQGGAQNPGLRFSGPADTLEPGDGHSFVATSASGSPIIYSVTQADGSPTTLASIADNGWLTATAAGTLRVIATVAADGTDWRQATTHHALTITRLPVNLAITTAHTNIPQSGGAITLTATTDSSAAITWSADATTVATISDNGNGSATLTPVAAGTVTVTAEAAETATQAAASATLEITVNALQAPNLRFVAALAEGLPVGESYSFAATSDNTSGAITYSVSDDALATIDASGLLTVTGAGTVDVIATLAADTTWSGAALRHRLTTRLAPRGLRFTHAPRRILSGQGAPFLVNVWEGRGPVSWSLLESNTSAIVQRTRSDFHSRVVVGDIEETLTLQVALSETATHASETITVPVEVTHKVDFDGDGLIEIYSLEMLHNMRHNLAGSSYKNAADAEGRTTGCPGAVCTGYELANDLDFDINGDGFTRDTLFFVNGSDVDENGPWFDEDGWQPIGDRAHPFTATLEGNGFVIRNLAVVRRQAYNGLFGVTSGTLRNLGLEQALVRISPNSGRNTYAGLLTAWMESGSITASYASGWMRGSGEDRSHLGGLVGFQKGGTLIASHAGVTVDDEGGAADYVGGLVGFQQGGTLAASYATGDVGGGSGESDTVGGLVGYQGPGATLTASYASGTADGGEGSGDRVGRLVGYQRSRGYPHRQLRLWYEGGRRDPGG